MPPEYQKRKIVSSAEDPIHTVDSGEHTNPEQWLHDYHWDTDGEVEITVDGVPGVKVLGAAVGSGLKRRVREITVRSPATQNIVLHVRLQTTADVKLSLDVPAQTTRQWSSQDGRLFNAAAQPEVYVSNLPAGTTIFVSAAGVEAAVSS